MRIKLLPHQIDALERVKGYNNVAFYHQMGAGKTFTGSEQMFRYGLRVNMVVCQKSKVQDWIGHFRDIYGIEAVDLTSWRKQDWVALITHGDESYLADSARVIYIINYDLVWRRPKLKELENFTLMLDESSMIANESKRSKFILGLHPAHVILLSGTVVSGKYETLWSQCRLLGWNIKRRQFWDEFVISETMKTFTGQYYVKVKGYKNVARLKEKLKKYGADFLELDEVIDLPDTTDIPMTVDNTMLYLKFKKHRAVEYEDRSIMGDTMLTYHLRLRQLATVSYNKNKLDAISGLLQSTSERVVIFYNFEAEFLTLRDLCDGLNRPISYVNGHGSDLTAYNDSDDSVILCQYQSAAMGLNLQKSRYMIFASPTERCELYMQAKKRIHRIGQSRPCFYYQMIADMSIEKDIYHHLDLGIDYTEELFRKEHT